MFRRHTHHKTVNSQYLLPLAFGQGNPPKGGVVHPRRIAKVIINVIR